MPALTAALFSASAACAARRAAAIWTLTAGLVLGPIICASRGLARALRAARAGLDQEILAARRPGMTDRRRSPRLGLAPRCGATSAPSASTPGSASGGGRSPACRRPQLVVDVVGREFALDARERAEQRLQNALQVRQTRLRALVRARLLGSELGQMRVERRMDRRPRSPTREAPSALSASRNLSSNSRTTGSGSSAVALRRQRVDAIVDRVDLLGNGFEVDSGWR